MVGEVYMLPGSRDSSTTVFSLATTGIVFAVYWQGALKAAPIFLDCVDGMVLAPPCEWGVFARFGRNLANFLWCTALTVASVHLVLQPILILSLRSRAIRATPH